MVAYGDREAQLPLIVVSGSGPNLFGRNWLREIWLDWGSIYKVQGKNLDEVLKKYSDTFKPELGTLKGYEKTDVDLDAQPHLSKARSVHGDAAEGCPWRS